MLKKANSLSLGSLLKCLAFAPGVLLQVSCSNLEQVLLLAWWRWRWRNVFQCCETECPQNEMLFSMLWGRREYLELWRDLESLGFSLGKQAGVWLPQRPSWHSIVVTHRGICTQRSSPSHNGYKYDSWNLPNNRQEQYSQQAGGEQLSMKETPAEVGIHCFLLMFITVPKSGKNRLLAFKNNFLPSLYCLEESVLLEHSCFGDRENYLPAWVKFHLRLLSRLSR